MHGHNEITQKLKSRTKNIFTSVILNGNMGLVNQGNCFLAVSWGRLLFSNLLPPHLLRHVPKHVQCLLSYAILDVWQGNHIPTAWVRSRCPHIQKEGPTGPPELPAHIRVHRHLWHIDVLGPRVTQAASLVRPNIQHGALQGGNTTTLATNLLNELHPHEGCDALLDVSKGVLLVPRSMLMNIIGTAGTFEPRVRMIDERNCSTPAVLALHGFP